MQKEIPLPGSGLPLPEDLLLAKDATINLAIGQSCPVRCEGCYNHFGDSFRLGGLISAAEIISFAEDAKSEGVTQATISGGDPLSHPEIMTVLSGLKEQALKVKLDTVGTAFLDEARVIFKGRGRMRHIDVREVARAVDFVNIPLDGATQETISAFRKGRANLFRETRLIAGLLLNADVSFGYNTVANQANINELGEMQAIAEADHATEWQIFEYDPNGPNPTGQKGKLQLPQGAFQEAASRLAPPKGSLKISCKSLAERGGIYFLVDDSGLAWKPAGNGLRRIIGHITTDRDKVMSALREHLQELRRKSNT